MKHHSLNTILYGPPGTGKTYNTIYKALSIIDEKSEADLQATGWQNAKVRFDKLLIRDLKAEPQHGRIGFITFHQSLSYEDFIEGIKPRLDEGEEEISYELKDGLFKYLCVIAKIGPSLGANASFDQAYQRMLVRIAKEPNGKKVLSTLKQENRSHYGAMATTTSAFMPIQKKHTLRVVKGM